MSSTLTTFLFEVANFSVLAAVLGWLFFKPVRQALIDHRVKFEADNELAAKKLLEADKLQQDIESTKANLQTELRELRQQSLEQARLAADKIVADARAVSERERENLQRQAAQISDQQRDALANATVSVAAYLVQKILEQIDGPDLQNALLESACQQLRSLQPGAIGPVKIESAQAFTDQQLAKLNDTLKACKVATQAQDFRQVEGLGSGIRISTAQGLIDASVNGLTQFARRVLALQMERVEDPHHFSQGVGHE